MESCARKYDLARHTAFNTEIAGLRDGTRTRALASVLKTADGEKRSSPIVVSGVGQLNVLDSEIEAFENFKGGSVSFRAWRHDVDLTGRKLRGGSASARARCSSSGDRATRFARLNIFQRTPTGWGSARRFFFFSRLHGGRKRALKADRILALSNRWLIYSA